MADEFGGPDGPSGPGGPNSFDIERLSDGQLDDLLDGLLRAHPDLIPDPAADYKPIPEEGAGQVEVTVAPIEITPPQQPEPAPVHAAPTEAIPITRNEQRRRGFASPMALGISTAAALLVIVGLFALFQQRDAPDTGTVATMPETESVDDTPAPTPGEVTPSATPTEQAAAEPGASDTNAVAAATSSPTPTSAAGADQSAVAPSAEATSAPSPTAVAAPTAIAAPSATTVPTAVPAPTDIPTPTVEPTSTATPTTAPTVAPTATATPEPSPTVEPTATPTPTPEPVPTVLVGAEVAQAGCPYNASYENGLASIDTPVFGDSQTTVGGTNVDGAAHVELRIRNVDQALYWIGSSWHPAAQSIFVPIGGSWSFDAPLPAGTYCIVARGRDAANGGSDRGNTIAFTVTPNQAPPIVAGGGSGNPVNLVLSPGNGATVYASGEIRMMVAAETTSFQVLDSAGTDVPIDQAVLTELLAGTRVVVPLAPGDYTLVGTSPAGTDTHVLQVR